MRLWANTKAKELCSEWNMNMFFRLIHNDMSGICLERLNEVRAPGKCEIYEQLMCREFFSRLQLFFLPFLFYVMYQVTVT